MLNYMPPRRGRPVSVRRRPARKRPRPPPRRGWGLVKWPYKSCFEHPAMIYIYIYIYRERERERQRFNSNINKTITIHALTTIDNMGFNTTTY